MAEGPISARILKVLAQENHGFHTERIVVRFEYEGKTREESFPSPIMNEANLRLWRRLVVSVVLNRKGITETDARVVSFDAYRNAIENQDVFVAYDGGMVYAIGRNRRNLFFPHEYDLVDYEDDKTAFENAIKEIDAQKAAVAAPVTAEVVPEKPVTTKSTPKKK